MKDIIIKKTVIISIFHFLGVLNVGAMTFDSIDELIKRETGRTTKKKVHAKVKKRKVKDITVGKDGEFIISWGVLAEYDLKTKAQNANLKKILNKEVSIKGFMIPLDYSSKFVKEFLLVPYMPTCAHVPPPGPKNIIKVNVEGKKKIKLSYAPVRVVGKLSLIKNTKKKADPYGMQGIYQMSGKSVKVERK